MGTSKNLSHISDFIKYKKICELSKTRSPLKILFCTIDLPDEWLIDVVEYKPSSGVVSENYIITRKQIPDYMNLCKISGHDILEEFK